MELVVTILTGIILLLSITFNFLAENEKLKRRRCICWLHNRGVMLGEPPLKGIQKSMYIDLKSLKMRNSGTPLSDEKGTLHYTKIKQEGEYVGKGFAI